MGSVLSAAAVTAIAVTLVACEKRPDHKPEQALPPLVGLDNRLFEVGETAGSRHFSLTVKNVRACTLEPHLRPPSGTTTIGVQVEIQSHSALEVPANAFYGRLETDTGARFESTLAGCKPVLPARRLTDDGRAEGWISFNVPEKHRRFRFVYQPVVIGATGLRAQFRVEL